MTEGMKWEVLKGAFNTFLEPLEHSPPSIMWILQFQVCFLYIFVNHVQITDTSVNFHFVFYIHSTTILVGHMLLHAYEYNKVKKSNYNLCFTGSHLSNQDYDICIRRGADMCVVCYSPTTGATPASFGLR